MLGYCTLYSSYTVKGVEAMLSRKFFTISEFARLMGVSRQTLIYYDRIGLFKPIRTLDNGYRLYARSQINVISLISMLGEMGVPLREIKTIVDRISPDTAIEVLERQRHQAQEQLRRLSLLEEMIALRIEQIACGKRVAEGTVPPLSFVELGEDVPLYLGRALDCPWDEIPEDEIVDFYAQCEALGLPLIFSGGQMKRREDVLAGRTGIVSRMCFALKGPTGANAAIPRGRYAVGYARGGRESLDGAYAALRSFVEESGMRITGDAYEEYLIDELAESDPDRFVVRIMLRVG